MSPNLFSWHSGDNALVCAIDAGNGNVGFLGFPGTMLRQAGWKIDDNEARRILPRFDAQGPRIALDTNVSAAAAGANGVRKIDQALRRR